jgi:hypothetical protein
MVKKNPKVSDTVTYSQTFAAVMQKRDDKIVPVVKSSRWFHHQMNKFKEGEEVTLAVHNRRPKRTEQQNRYYWGVYLPLVSKETGEADLDRLHELFKGKFLSSGVVEVLGEKVRMKKSTTELGVAEFCQYIMDIETLTQVAAPPTESYGLAPLRSDIEQNNESEK